MNTNYCPKKFNDARLVAELSDGVVQSKSCQYYYGASDFVEFGSNKFGIAMLHNPKDSGKVIYLNKLSCANYSNTPIKVEVFAKAGVNGKIKESENIKPGNSKCLDTYENSGQILYGSNIIGVKGEPVYLRSIMPYDTSDGFPRGSIILYPGSSRIYVLRTIGNFESALGSLSFAWWEEPC